MRVPNFQDPATRAKFHRLMAAAWFVSMWVCPFLPCFHTKDGIGLLLVVEVSLYANWATHLGAMDSAKASDQTEPE